jgi:hypothetical protein
MNKYAVLCGNSQFPDEADKNKLPDLACPEKDVDGLAKALSSEQGEFDVLSLKNKPSYQVLHELQRTVNKTQQDDLLLLYYSGHGKPNKSGILYLTSFDTVVTELEATAIPIIRIYEILSTGKCKKIVIILDCCYSGAAGQGHKGDLDAQLQQLNNSRGTYLVTASTGMQVAHESAVEGLSLFTKHLIAGLETGDADKDGDGLVDMDELYDYVHSKVKAENPNQEPTEFATDKRGDLIIAKSGRDSRKERAEKIRLLLLELEKQDEAVAEIKSEALSIAKMPYSQLSTTQLLQDELLSKLLSQKITPFSFVRAWDKLIFEIEKVPQEKSAQEQVKLEELNQVEKLKHEKLERENIAKEKISTEHPKTWKKYVVWGGIVSVIISTYFLLPPHDYSEKKIEPAIETTISPQKPNQEVNVQGYTSKTCEFGGLVGQLIVTNDSLYPINAKLYHSDTGELYSTKRLEGGETLNFGIVGDSWGIQLGGSKVKCISSIAEWDKKNNTFNVSSSKFYN